MVLARPVAAIVSPADVSAHCIDVQLSLDKTRELEEKQRSYCECDWIAKPYLRNCDGGLAAAGAERGEELSGARM